MFKYLVVTQRFSHLKNTNIEPFHHGRKLCCMAVDCALTKVLRRNLRGQDVPITAYKIKVQDSFTSATLLFPKASCDL
jgi:hypothetical protein